MIHIANKSCAHTIDYSSVGLNVQTVLTIDWGFVVSSIDACLKITTNWIKFDNKQQWKILPLLNAAQYLDLSSMMAHCSTRQHGPLLIMLFTRNPYGNRIYQDP